MSAHLSFLPLSAGGLTQHSTTRRIPAMGGQPACTEVTVYKLTSDPKMLVRICEVGFADGRRTRSTVLIDKETGEIKDRLDLASDDDGRRWRVSGARAGRRG